MRALTLAAAALVVAIWLSALSTIQAQSPDDKSSDPIIQEYLAKLPVLIERYSTNRKIRIRDIGYVIDPIAGQRIGDERFNIVSETITDGQQIKGYVLEGKFADPMEEQRKTDVYFWRPDMRFDVRRQGTQFKIVNKHLAGTSLYSREPEKYLFYAHAPMLAAGATFGTSLWFDRGERKSVIITIADVNRVERNGRTCIEVRTKWDNRHGMIDYANTYLDPANDYIAIAGESDWKKIGYFGKVDEDAPKEFRTFFDIEYAPSAEGYPLPKYIRRTTQYNGTPVLKSQDVEFLSYEKYTPSPEEFQLEKPYGLTTPAVAVVEEKPAVVPAAAPRSYWRWIVIGAGLLPAGIAFVIFLLGRLRPRRQP